VHAESLAAAATIWVELAYMPFAEVAGTLLVAPRESLPWNFEKIE